MDAEQLLEDVGGFSRYQKKIFLLFCFPIMVYNACQMCLVVFVGAEPQFSCLFPNNHIAGYCGGHGNTTCTRFQYHSNFTSVATEWDLVCSDAYLLQLSQTYFMAGVMVGNVVAGWLSDRYGRRKAFFPFLGLTVFCSIASGFAYSYRTFALLRFAVGVFCGGEGLIIFVLVAELVSSKRRALVSTLVSGSMYAIGLMIFSGIGYLIREWRKLTLVTSLPGVLFIGYYWLLVESPQWLASRQRYEEAIHSFRRIARENNTLQKVERLLKESTLCVGKTAAPASARNYSILDLIRYPSLRMMTFIQMYIWNVNACVYYGLTMGKLSENIYLGLCLSALVELPSNFVAHHAVGRLGRKFTLAGFLFVGGLSCIVIMFVPLNHPHIITGCGLLGKSSISASFVVIYLHSAELYPTVVRNIGLGACTMSSRIGAMLSPFIIHLGTVYPSINFLVFGIMTLVAGVLTFKLEETLNKPLENDIAELTPDRSGPVSGRFDLEEDKVRLLAAAIDDNSEDTIL